MLPFEVFNIILALTISNPECAPIHQDTIHEESRKEIFIEEVPCGADIFEMKVDPTTPPVIRKPRKVLA